MTRPTEEITAALALLEAHPTLQCERDAYDVAKVRVEFLWAGVCWAMRWYLGREGYKGRIATKLAELTNRDERHSAEVALFLIRKYKTGLTWESAQTRMECFWLGTIWGLWWILGEPGPVADKLQDIRDGGGLELHTVEHGPTVLEGVLRSAWPEKTAEESVNPYG